MCRFEVADVVSGHLASMLLISQDLKAGFLNLRYRQMDLQSSY